MRKILTLLTVVMILMISATSYAQTNTGKVKGSIVDENNKVVPKATITILRAKDSSAVKLAATDADGGYEFENLPAGNYLVMATAVGRNKVYSTPFEVKPGQELTTVGGLKLVQVSKALGGVSVTSRKPFVEQKIDRTVINVDAAVTNVGSTALEVLEKAPGISVDKDGNISLKGKQGVMIYVDGRPSYLSGPDLANLLRTMNASQLDQLEIMTNPPAKYDAAGNAGVINIKLKKNKTVGFNGSISVGYGQGRNSKTNESLNLNYRNGKVNLFGNFSYNYNKNLQFLEIDRRFMDMNTKALVSIFEQEANMMNIRRSQNLKLGMDYFASKKTTLGVVLSGFSNPTIFENKNFTDIRDKFGVLQSRTLANTNLKGYWQNLGVNANMRHIFDSTGRELTVDLDYLGYDATMRQFLTNSFFNAAGNPSMPSDTLLGKLPTNITIYSAKADYAQPLKGGARFEMGVKTSFVETDNNAQYDSLKHGVKIVDVNRSNHFVYRENINAVYVNFNKQFNPKWGIQTGLRLENTNAKGNQLTTNINFKRNYTQLFPTVYVSYNMNEKNQFGLSYGRRIERPDYEDLNPFFTFLDKYTFQAGNPNLQPQFAHNFELNHIYKEGLISTSLNYSAVDDIIQDVIEQNEATNETFIKKSNIATQRNIGLAVNLQLPIKKWWRMNVFLNGFNNRFKGIVNGAEVDLGATSGMVNMSNQFTFAKGWSGEIGGWFRAGGFDGVFQAKPIGTMDLGVQKSILKKKGTLRLNVRDVFFTQRFTAAAKYSTVDIAFTQRRDSRVINLGFTYRFGKANGNTPRRRNTGGAGDEQNRVKSGGN
jgi:iron complex outermembrane recepter protein